MTVDHVHPRSIPNREELLRSINRACLRELRALRSAPEPPEKAPSGRKKGAPL